MFKTSEIQEVMAEEMDRDNMEDSQLRMALGNHGYQIRKAKTQDGTYEELLNRLMGYE